jgi:SNF2 family DNA or RNA helicase
MIELDSEWNAGKTDQARGRIDRMGQTKETTVHRILLAKSIELWMDQLVEDKRDMVDGFESEMDTASKLLEVIRSGEVEM